MEFSVSFVCVMLLLMDNRIIMSIEIGINHRIGLI